MLLKRSLKCNSGHNIINFSVTLKQGTINLSDFNLDIGTITSPEL